MTESAISLEIFGRLRAKARQERRSTQDLLRYYAIERFLYRLSQSPHADRFVLKGALIFLAWGFDLPRPTRDIDLRGSASIDIGTIGQIVQEICLQPVEDDGIIYDPASVSAKTVREGARYQGMRISFNSMLGKSRIRMQIDVGVADSITPSAKEITYPTLLDMPAPVLRGYPLETVVAEKFEAMVVLGEINSRMKDFYDVWLISQRFEVDGARLQKAVFNTFARRGTDLPSGQPVAFLPDFVESRQEMWQSFLARGGLEESAPADFSVIVATLEKFLLPIIERNPFSGLWQGDIGWQ